MVLRCPKRGDVIYIPFVLPDDWCTGLAYVCGVVAAVLVVASAASNRWVLLSSSFNDESNSLTDLTVSAQFGLRYVHFDVCSRIAGFQGRAAQSCGSADVLYTSCGKDSSYCQSMDLSVIVSFILFLVAALFLIIACIAGLRRAVFQPLGFLVTAVVVAAALVMAHVALSAFVPSLLVESWVDDPSATRTLGSGFYCALCGMLLCAAGAVIGSIGALWTCFKRVREQQAEEEGVAPPPVAY